MNESLTALHDPAMVRAQQRVGRTLREKWRLDRLLGVGGMASVYAATHRNGKQVAIKVLHTELSLDPSIRARFLREGYAANRVGHPGAVSVFDDDVADDGSVFLVMDLLHGETLEARRERKGGTLDVVDVLSISDQVLDILAAAHEKGIVHRDLKPENLFITGEGLVKVLDFGIARVRELSTKSVATQAGSTMGTPAYMASEQARGLWDEVDPRTDLWAIGATMFTTLTGRLVHDGRTVNEQLLSAMTKPAPSVSTLLRIPPAVAIVIDRALAFDKRERWADAQEMQQALRDAYQGMQGAVIGTAPRLVVPDILSSPTLPTAGSDLAVLRTVEPVSSGDTYRQLRRKRRGPFFAFGGAIAVAALVAGAIVVLGGRPHSEGRTASDAPSSSVPFPATSPAPSTAAPGASSASTPSALPTASAPVVVDLDRPARPVLGKAPKTAPSAAGAPPQEAKPMSTRKAAGPMESEL